MKELKLPIVVKDAGDDVYTILCSKHSGKVDFIIHDYFGEGARHSEALYSEQEVIDCIKAGTWTVLAAPHEAPVEFHKDEAVYPVASANEWPEELPEAFTFTLYGDLYYMVWNEEDSVYYCCETYEGAKAGYGGVHTLSRIRESLSCDDSPWKYVGEYIHVPLKEAGKTLTLTLDVDIGNSLETLQALTKAAMNANEAVNILKNTIKELRNV